MTAVHRNSSTFDVVSRHHFSIPSTLIHYISKNPISAKVLLKLQKTCKYFFVKNNIVVVTSCIYQDQNGVLYQNKKTKLNPGKYWLTNELVIFSPRMLNISKMFYYCTLRRLEICQRKVSLKEFDFLSNDGKVRDLRLCYTSIYDENETLVTCDQILAKFRNLIILRYTCKEEIFTSETFKRINALEFKSKLRSFEFDFYKLSSDCDIELLCKFVLKNAGSNNSSFYFNFWNENRSEYQSTLRHARDLMIQDNYGKGKQINVFIP